MSNTKDKKPNLVVVKSTKQQKKASKPNKTAKQRKLLPSVDKKRLLLVLAAIVMVVAIIYVITGKTTSIISEKDMQFSTDFGVNSKADFYVMDKNLFYCTKDTATLLDKKGEPVWSDTISMVSPAMLAEKNFAAVADIKNKVINVYGKDGKVYSLETDGYITAYAINGSGAVAVICKNTTDEDYSVGVYSSTGQKVFMGSYVSNDGIPMTIDISDDGSKVAVGFLNISDLNISSKILFYSTDKAIAQKIENSDAMFAAVNCNKEMVGKIRFLDDDSCIIATDKSLTNIGGEDVAAYEQNWKIDFPNYVTALDIVGNDYVAVAYGENIGTTESDELAEPNSIYWYKTSNGSEKGSVVMPSAVSSLTSGLGNTIAELEDNSFVALKASGKEIWTYSGTQNINSILFYGNTNKIAVVGATRMTITDVKNNADNAEVQTEQQQEQNTKAEKQTETTTKKAEITTKQVETTTKK